MFEKQARNMLLAFILGVAPFMPNVECLPLFEKDKIVHEKIKDKEDDKNVINEKIEHIIVSGTLSEKGIP